ncbi:hypothetical protein PQR25_00100 [Paraburkholderia nemoris]|uniref:hypothetical protein n=1 Tax=Paraburkholderia nemoris TaxID=2793076 RepID=UPI0038B88388
MAYTAEQQEELTQGFVVAQEDLRDVMFECLRQTESTNNAASRDYLRPGAARRLGVTRRAMHQVFDLFPLTTDRRLPIESLHDVQINLHAFVTNLYGFFENLAWAHVKRHGLLDKIGGRLKVSMFKSTTQEHMPHAVADYLASETMTRWHSEYLKNYRDALAHRIPLYIPPQVMTEEQSRRYSALELEKQSLVGCDNWGRIEAIIAEQDDIGSPCFSFVHSFEESEVSRHIFFHPQMISDSNTATEFGHLFLAAWHEHR